MQKQVIDYLSQFITAKRLGQFHAVLSQRTRYLTVALENIYQPHNASAVLRTCDCFGVQDVHVIENTNEYQVNPDVSLGSSKWLELTRYNRHENNTKAAIGALREKGYRIVATTPGEKAKKLEELDIHTGKMALFFGTELTGLSDMVMDEAEESVKIPMMGFTESFNISVSVAIILHFLSYTLRKSDISWKLSDIEKDEILYSWLKKSIKKSGLLVEKFLSENKLP